MFNSVLPVARSKRCLLIFASLCIGLPTLLLFESSLSGKTVSMGVSRIAEFVQHVPVKLNYGKPVCKESMTPTFTCIDRYASQFGRAEDIFCLVLPKFLPRFKNPCFYDYGASLTWRLRCLPYFYIIGMDKSGSTDLHNRLILHPLVRGNLGTLHKETMFWSWKRYGVFNKRMGERNLTLEEYLDKFQETADLLQNSNTTEIITGDATPMDLWDFRSWKMIPQNTGRTEPVVLTPHLLKHLHEQTPKFVIQFREPVERLYSDYIFLGYGKNIQQFHQHALQAIEMMTGCLKKYSARICYFSADLYQKLPARIHLGCYSVWLKEWFQVFHRSAFHITRTDEYQNDPRSTLLSLFKFLDLPQVPELRMAQIVNQTRRHVTAHKNGSLLPETVTALRQFYQSCNEETAALLEDTRYLWRDHYL